jgi:iron complex outermembrane receptor protein
MNMSRAAAKAAPLWGCALFAFADPAAAQTNETRAEPAGAAGAVEEVIVSARRREEAVQEVPISIVALNAEQLQLRGVQRVEDLALLTPNVVLMGGGATGETSGNFHMRGIPGVATYVDGIWQSTDAGLLTMNVVEVERIEVLRGPQGTLFGKNSTGGAIQYVTKRPAETFGARVDLTVGSYKRRDITAAVDIPINDTLLTKVTAANLRRDGFVKSITTNRAFGDFNDQLLRGDVLWRPKPEVRVRAIAETSKADRNGSARVLDDVRLTNARPRAYNSAGFVYTPRSHVAGFPGGEVGKFETKSDVKTDGYVYDLDRYTLDAEWDFSPNFMIKSLTGYRNLKDKVYTDWDAAEITLIEDDRRRRSKQFTQEVQLHGDFGERFNFVAGGFYWNENAATRTMRWTFTEFRTGELSQAAVRAAQPGFSFTPGNSDDYTGAETSGTAIFGEANFKVTPRLELTVGARQNWEKTDNYRVTPTGAPMPALPDTEPAGNVYAGAENVLASAKFKSFTPRLSAKYQWTDDIMTYASYAEGFSAGGINVNPVLGVVPYDPETLTNYEIGFRSEWLERRLRLNVTAFRASWEGIQLSQAPPDPNNPGLSIPNPIIVNAAAAKAKGVEVESVLVISKALRLNANVGYLDTRYTDPGDASQIQLNSTFASAPKWSYSLGAQYTHQMTSGGEVVARADWGWMDDYQRSRETRFQSLQKAFGLLNARVHYQPPSGKWRLSLFGTNLTNQKYLNSGMLSGAFSIDAATVGRPREVGLSLQLFLN